MMSRRLALAGLLALATLPSLGAAAQERPKVVASFSILGDLVQKVGGDRIEVVTLVGPDGDAHVFQPSPNDARNVAEAKLVVVNGLGFEGWIDRLVKASGYSGPVATASAGVAPREMAEEEEHAQAHRKPGARADAHEHGDIDPHAWQSVANAKIYVGNIRDALVKADPAGREIYEANAKAYAEKLDALEAEVRAAVARIPAERRRIITSHDAFGYFAASYGVQFIAPRGVSTETEASAKDVARIITQIKTQKIPAVFLENISSTRLMEQIARETGAKVGGKLYSDALSGPDGPAPTYIEMMRHNVRQLGSALTG
jgi:zinc/manganese transport system substrate-binding protein